MRESTATGGHFSREITASKSTQMGSSRDFWIYIQESWRLVAVSTTAFFLVAHAFGVLGGFFAYDSLEFVMNDATYAWQISLGRFMQPVYWVFRGHINTPWFMGLIGLFWLICAAILVVGLFEFRTKTAIVLTCGVLCVNSSVTQLIGLAMPFFDQDMLTVFLVVLGVALTRRLRFGWALSIVPLFIALGIYQSYISIAITLYLALLIVDVLDGKSNGRIFSMGVRSLASLLLAAVVYRLAYGFVLARTGIAPADSYNSLSNMGNLTITPEYILTIWLQPITYLLYPNTAAPRLAGLCDVAIGVLFVVCLVALLIRGKRPVGLAWCAAFLLLMPLGMNVSPFFAGGFSHDLMLYAYFFAYVVAISVFERWRLGTEGSLGTFLSRAPWIVGCLLVGVVLFESAAYANQVYVKEDLEYQTAVNYTNRLMDRIEQVPGYVPGETPVVVLGEIAQSPLTKARPGFDYLSRGFGMGVNTPIGDGYMAEEWFKYILGCPINIKFDSIASDIDFTQDPQFQSMPVYPQDGSVVMRDGTVYVKVSQIG